LLRLVVVLFVTSAVISSWRSFNALSNLVWSFISNILFFGWSTVLTDYVSLPAFYNTNAKVYESVDPWTYCMLVKSFGTQTGSSNLNELKLKLGLLFGLSYYIPILGYYKALYAVKSTVWTAPLLLVISVIEPQGNAYPFAVT